MTPPLFVVAVVATRGRPRELARLLASLERVTGLGAAVIVDNGNETVVRDVVAAASLDTCYVASATNLGCGGGLALAERTALDRFDGRLTHVWILDDDAVVPPDVLPVLIDAMARTGADAACPMIVGPQGRVGWFPGLLDADAFRAIRTARTPADYLASRGTEPVRFSWSTGVSLLVARRAIDTLGVHRDDYWVRGEDLEFSLRITHRGTGIFVPTVTVQHLPPSDLSSGGRVEMLKQVAMLQNLAYTGVHLSHGRCLLRTIPGNVWRFVRAWPARHGITAARALWRGAVLGRPAGRNGPRDASR